MTGIRKEISTYQQRLDYTCYPVSAIPILESLGIIMKENEIIDVMGDNPDGYSWSDGHELFRKMGFVSSIFRDSTFDELFRQHQKGNYIIVCYNDSPRSENPGSHFSAVYQIEDDSITLADPSYGDYVTYSKEQFVKIWFDDEGKKNFQIIQSQT
jgi:predicted double-glycine peptidase